MNSNPFRDLLSSRSFWLLILDTVVALITLTISSFYPQSIEIARSYIMILQPVFIFVITKMAVQNVAGIQAEAKVEAASIAMNGNAPTVG